MTVYSRGYTDADLPLLQQMLAGWVQAHGHSTGYCHPGDIPHRIYNGTRGRYPLAELVKLYFDDDILIGFIFGQPYHNGFDAFIDPQRCDESQERQMLDRIWQITRRIMDEIGREDKTVMADVLEFDTRRSTALLDIGFTAGRNWINETRRELVEPIPEPVLPDGFTIRPACAEDYEQLAAVHVGAFNSGWTPELYRDEVMSKPGYDPEREMVVVAPDGRFAAFCVYWLDTLNSVGLFEPVGTHSDFQRMGLASALMHQTMQIMRERGMREAEVCHATDNPASTNLYASLGFKLQTRVNEYTK